MKTWLYIVFIIFCGRGFSQEPLQALPTEEKNNLGLLVQLKESASKAVIQEAIGGTSNQWEPVVEVWRIWRIAVPEASKQTMYYRLKEHPGVALVQEEHRLERRFNPGDPLIANQQHLGPIKAYEAWDLNLGGIDANGDTMVVAVIDDGMDTTHPDMQRNLWRNYKEVPWNGIDEDSNGYIDDYFGWNGVNENGRVVGNFEGEHGTPIAGLIGAEGGNGKGVAGINHKIKVMPLMGFGISDVGMIRCYAYVVAMKKLWLSSGGKKGAHIVATNTSIGIDRAKPSDNPLWCAMYDTLGVYGILSTAATTNSNRNVETDGDMPSLCPSPYLIVVGNSTAQDQWTPSGFGTVSVDLVAPGEASYSIKIAQQSGPAGPYGAFGGTSGAAPQVAGAAAWVLSVTCKTFLNYSKQYPDSAVKQLKQWILEGVDTLSGLNGLVVTSGRLNLVKAKRKMDLWCMAKEQGWGTNSVGSIAFQIFPNPVLGVDGQAALTIQLPFKEDPTQIVVNDMTGRSTSAEIKNVGDQRWSLELKGVSAGYYQVIVTTKKGIGSVKLLIRE